MKTVNRDNQGIYVKGDKPRLDTVPDRIGLIAGEGNFPVVLARAAHGQGVQIVTFGVSGLASDQLAHYSRDIHLLKLTEFSKMIKLCHERGIRHVIMAGRVPHNLVLIRHLTLDPRMLKVLGSMKDRRADSLLSAAVAELESEGIQVLDSTMFLKSMMPEPGLITRRVPPSEDVIRDLEFAYPIAKEIGRLDIGQTIAVKDGVVIAVEALEGTDKLIKRAGELVGAGAVIVKIAKPAQDMRFDVPVIGITTVRNLAAAQAACLCITANQSLFFDRTEAVELAEQNRICLVARDENSPLRSHFSPR